MTPRPGSTAFLRDLWRRQPALFPSFFEPEALASIDRQKFRAWCQKATSARLFLRTEAAAPGAAAVRRMSGTEALAIYDHYGAMGEKVTILLNRVDALDETVARIHHAFSIPFAWRRDDDVATLSTADSGIGYHAGAEDGFIVQVRGRRLWRVWGPEVLSESYRAVICGSPSEQERRDERANSSPLVECTLNAGDALYIPALFPHEGLTLDESISLSIAWRGVSAYELWRSASGPVACHPDEIAPLFFLLDDPDPGGDACVALGAGLRRAVDRLPERLRLSSESMDAVVRSRVSLVPKPDPLATLAEPLPARQAPPTPVP